MTSETELVCEKHGAYPSREIELMGRKITRTSCPACASESDAERAIEHAALERERVAARWKSRIGGACIPDRFAEKTLATYVANTDGKRVALAFATGYSENFRAILETGKGAVFLGKPGTGKTHLSVGIALAAIEQGHSALFLTVMRAIRRIKETWSRDSEYSETEAIESLVFPDLLILDEVGVQFGSETEKLLLFEVLNERYELRKPTLLLSNLSLSEVKAYLGERVFDRLREDGGQVVIFDWESYRGNRPLDLVA